MRQRTQSISVLAGLLGAMIGTANAIAEQAGSANPQEQAVYQTKAVVLDNLNMAEWAGASYWVQKLGAAFELALDPRMQVDAEERDAVLATAWQLRPKTVTAEKRITAIIPRRTTKPQSKDLAYQITFLPRAGAQNKDLVEALFLSEGAGVRPVAASAPIAGAIPRLPARYHTEDSPRTMLANIGPIIQTS